MSILTKITGIVGRLFQFGLGGPQWKGFPDNGFFDPARIEAKSANDGALVKVRGGSPVDTNDLVPLGYINGLAIPYQYFGATPGSAPDEIAELFGFIDWAKNNHAWTVRALVIARDVVTNDCKAWEQVAVFKTDGFGVVSQVGVTTDTIAPIGDPATAPWTFMMAPAAAPDRVAFTFETGPATTANVNVQAVVAIVDTL